MRKHHHLEQGQTTKQAVIRAVLSLMIVKLVILYHNTNALHLHVKELVSLQTFFHVPLVMFKYLHKSVLETRLDWPVEP